MFDIGWTEILMIAVIAIVVFPTKDLPRLLRTTGQMIGRVRRMAGDFQSQFNSALREAEREVDLADTRKKVEGLKGLNPVTDLKKALNPLRAAGEDIKRELTGNGASKRVASQFVPPAAGVAAKAVADPAKVDVPAPGVVPTEPPRIEATKADEKSKTPKQKPMNVPVASVAREPEKVEAAPRKAPKPRTAAVSRPNGDSSAAPLPAKPGPRKSRTKPIATAEPQPPPAGSEPSSDGGSR